MKNWQKFSQRWYFGYAFQGAVVLGIAPILLPIIVGNNGSAAQAGTVVAAFYLGQLLAPVLGAFTDKTGLHKTVYLSGYFMLAAGLALFPFTSSMPFWLGLSFLQGAGSAATNTVSAMFIVEWKPKDEWDPRIGWLQTFYGAGQAVGLGLAALLQVDPGAGLCVAAALMIPGIFFGRMELPKSKRKANPDVSGVNKRIHKRSRLPLPQTHHYEKILSEDLTRIAKEAKTPFGVLIMSWFLTMLGTWLIYNLYPLLMKSAYSIDAGPSSAYYALAAFLGIFAYAPSGLLGEKIGDGKVVMIGTVATLISQTGLAFLAFVDTGINAWLVPAFFILQPVAWSPLIVAGTAFAAQLTDMNEGAAVGLFNATTAIASVLSALGAGLLAEYFSYKSVPLVGAVLCVAGVVTLMPIINKGEKEKGGEQAQGAN